MSYYCIVTFVYTHCRYLIRNECVEFSPCGPPMAQLHGIDLLADVYERVGYPNNKLSDLKIEVEKFLVSGVTSVFSFKMGLICV